jgi:predicted nuclease of restriction endonuclease-like (RecB) superfamily
MAGELKHYSELLDHVKQRIRLAQTRAILSANAELVRLYWDIGQLIAQRQSQEGWGAGIIPRLARDLRNELPEVKGFSERNLKLMVQFAREYPHAFLATSAIGQPSVAQLPAKQIGQLPVAHVPWAHNVLLMQRVKDQAARRWYMQHTLANGWSRDLLALQIQANAHRRQGQAVTNFDQLLPNPQSDLAQQTLKDPYIFDFLTLEEPFHERELEAGLVRHLEKFLLELGQGFAFVGRQFRLEVGDEDFYIDLLFYQLKLRSFVVIDLKKGAFKPEYAGKLNFYCNVVNDRLRHPSDAPTIGLILCQTKDNVLAEYALAGIDKPIGVSSYELTRALPANLQSALPTVEEIEAELGAAAALPDRVPEEGQGMKSQAGDEMERLEHNKPLPPEKKHRPRERNRKRAGDCG